MMDTILVVGFEGALLPASPVHWAVAAIEDAGHVVNPTRRLRITMEEANELAETRDLTLLRLPIKAPGPAILDAPSIVYSVKKNEQPLTDLFRVDPGKAQGAVPTRHHDGRYYYYFRTEKQFRAFVREALARVVRSIIYDPGAVGDHIGSILKAALVLSPRDPDVWALRTIFAEDAKRQGVRALVRSLLKTDYQWDRYELLVDAALSEAPYVVKYTGGIARGGGFDVGAGRRLLAAWETVDDTMRMPVVEEFAFLDKAFPSARLQQLKAASAEMVFTAVLEHEPLATRMARYIQLRRFQEALNGEYPVELRGDSKFETALEEVATPTPDTKAEHSGLNQPDPVPVEPMPAEMPEIVDSFEVSVLGFLHGVFNDSRRIEVAVHVNKGRLISWRFSTTDNGEGARPAGLQFLDQKNDFLYRPCIVRALLRRDDNSREHMSLRSITFVEPGSELRGDAMLSTVVKGALVCDLDVQPIVQDGVLTVHNHTVNVSAPSRPKVHQWLGRLAETRHNQELSLTPDSGVTWKAPARVPKATELDRVLVALGVLGGGSTIPQVIEVVNDRFDSFVRTNNTRRTVIRNPRYLRFVGLEENSIEATNDGNDYLKAYLRAGGSTGDVG